MSIKSLILFLLTVFSLSARAENCTLELKFDGAIGPATLDFFQRGLSRVKDKNCDSMLVLINTPGGSLQSTRIIVEEILASPVPILCLVHPSGGHAGSAGAIILQACHVSGAIVATNIGAATPVASTGQEVPEDLRKKLLNDSKSWLEGITKLRERNEQFGQDIIVEAKAVSAKEALKIGAIDFVGDTKSEFLEFAKDRNVKMSGGQTADVKVGALYTFNADLRHHAMTMLTDPQVAYMIFMGSLGLLYYEVTHPGLIVPGVIGGIGLVVGLMSLHKLDVEMGGLILLLLGIALLIAEAFVASFGILGVGGVVSFFLGSIFLFDPETSEHTIPMSVIIPTTVVLGLATLGIAYMAFNSTHARMRGDFHDLVGHTGVIAEVGSNGLTGFMEINGETWKFKSAQAVKVGDEVLVKTHKGLTLEI